MHLGVDFIKVTQEKYIPTLESNPSNTNSKKGVHILWPCGMQISMAFCGIQVFYSYSFTEAIIVDVIKYTALYFCNTGLQFLSK
jgi:hypothetical protein